MQAVTFTPQFTPRSVTPRYTQVRLSGSDDFDRDTIKGRNWYRSPAQENAKVMHKISLVGCFVRIIAVVLVIAGFAKACSSQ